MKIVLTVEGDEFGGAEKSLVNLVRNSSKDVSFEIVGRDCVGMRQLEKRLPELPSRLMQSKSSTIQTIFEHRREYLYCKADLVQITLCNPGAATVSQLAALSAGLPTIVVEQLVRQFPSRREWLFKHIISRFLVDHVAVGVKSARQVELFFSTGVEYQTNL